MLIMMSSLALTKMDCSRIANYFMLPVFLAIAYFNVAHPSHKPASAIPIGSSITHEGATSTNGDVQNYTLTNKTMAVQYHPYLVAPAFDNLADSCELVLCNGLAGLSVLQGVVAYLCA